MTSTDGFLFRCYLIVVKSISLGCMIAGTLGAIVFSILIVIRLIYPTSISVNPGVLLLGFMAGVAIAYGAKSTFNLRNRADLDRLITSRRERLEGYRQRFE